MYAVFNLSYSLGSVLVDFYHKVAQQYMVEAFTLAIFNEIDDEDSDEDDDGIRLLRLIRQLFWNFSDSSKRFGEQIGENKKLFNILGNDLRGMQKETHLLGVRSL